MMKTMPRRVQVSDTPILSLNIPLKYPGDICYSGMNPADKVLCETDIPRSKVFGILLATACEVLTQYHSDLYHDVITLHNMPLQSWLDGFWWRVTDSNTWFAPAKPGRNDLSIDYLVKDLEEDRPAVFLFIQIIRHDDWDAILTVSPVTVKGA